MNTRIPGSTKHATRWPHYQSAVPRKAVHWQPQHFQEASDPETVPALHNFARIAVFDRLELNPENVTDLMEQSRGTPISSKSMPDGIHANLHAGHVGELVAAAHKAEALTIGTDIFGRDNMPPTVLRHELAHAAQAVSNRTEGTTADLEREADLFASESTALASADLQFAAPVGLPLHHPAIKTLLRAGKWLARRSTDTLSKHVARHGRNIAGRAVHSVFKDPTEVKTLATKAVGEAAALAKKYATKGADDILEEGGVRVMIQPTGVPGKVRTVIEKDFGKAIGTQGETIIRVVLDQSGRVVTAFPVQRLALIGAGTFAVDVFTAKTAEAAEKTRETIEEYENRPINWGEIAFDIALDVASLGLLASSPVNEGEDFMLELERIVWEAAQATIMEIEEKEGITLTEDQKWAIYELAQVAVGSPMEFEALEEEASQAATQP